MIDELSIYARLDSPLYGSLVHAVEVLSQAVEADTAAGRLFGAPVHGLNIHVSPKRLAIQGQHAPALMTWPMDRGSVFDLMRQRAMHDTTFRVDDLPLPADTTRQQLLQCVHRHAEVRDALAVSVSLCGGVWCAIVLVRCGNSGPFDDAALDTLRRFRPAISTRLSHGCRLELNLDPGASLAGSPAALINDAGGAHAAVTTASAIGYRPTAPATAGFPAVRASHPALTPDRADPQELLDRLSSTEQQVLHHLREEKTEREIARTLHRSPHTIHVHVKSIYRKLMVCSRKELLRLFQGAAQLSAVASVAGAATVMS